MPGHLHWHTRVFSSLMLIEDMCRFPRSKFSLLQGMHYQALPMGWSCIGMSSRKGSTRPGQTPMQRLLALVSSLDWQWSMDQALIALNRGAGAGRQACRPLHHEATVLTLTIA